MNQQQLEALLAQMGALGPNDFREETKQEDVPNPAAKMEDGTPVLGAAPTIKGPVVYRTWVKPGTNIRLTVKVNDDGTYTQVFSGADPDIKAAPTTTATTQKPPGGSEGPEGTPDASKPNGFDNERPRWVIRDKNGGIVFVRPLEQKERDDWERDRNSSRGLGRKTEAEVEAENKETKGEDRKPVPNRPGWTQITRTTTKGGVTTSKVTFIGPTTNGQEVDTLPEAPTTPKPEQDGNGNWGYWENKPGQPPKWVPIQGATPVGEPPKPVEVDGVLGVWKPGPDGVPVFTAVARPATPAGPSLPEFVVGQSAAALRAYYEQVSKDPNLSPAQRVTLINGAIQMAQVAANEAATVARQQESNLNATVNLATTKLGAGQTAMKNALEFVNSINGKLPEGSDLGGKAFVALLGLQMLQAQASGIYDVPIPGQAPAGTAPRLASVSDARQVETQRAQVAAQVAQAAAATARAEADPTGPNVDAANASTQVASQAAFGAVTGASAADNEQLTYVNTSTGEGWSVRRGDMAPGMHEDWVRQGWELQQPPTPAPVAAPTPPATEPVSMAPAPDFPVLAAYQQPAPSTPAFTPPANQVSADMTMLNNPAPSASTAASAPSTASEWPALQTYTAPTPQPAQPMQGTPAALLHAKAAATPPWQMSEAEYNEMRAAGVPDEVFWAVPGAA